MITKTHIAASLPLLALIGACTAVPPAQTAAPPQRTETVQPIAAPTPAPTPTPTPTGPTTFVFDGQTEQGGWIRGQVPGGTVSARLGDQALAIDDDGRFFAAFDRDQGLQTELVARLADGREIRSPVAVRPRDWQIERVNIARRAGGASESFMAVREPELARINSSRARETGSDGWRQDFMWPVTGRISGRFGSQRIYRGEPGSYHSGLDIAPGAGVAFVAPADGVVVLAAPEEFSLEGKLLIIDHGQGLNSAFLHAQRLDVREGDTVRKGQQLGLVGATGRATGPHLHWSLKWRDARLDPLLFLGPMP